MLNPMTDSKIVSLLAQPTQEQVWNYIQASPERLAKLKEIAHQAFLPEYIGSDSRRSMQASVKSSYYLLNLANEIGEKSQLEPKKSVFKMVA